MNATELIYDTIRHEAKEATKNSPNMRFGVDWSSYWHNLNEYFEYMQKIGEENKQIYNINMQAKSRGYYTDSEQKELMMYGNARNEHIMDALKHFYSAGEDANGMCKFINNTNQQLLNLNYRQPIRFFSIWRTI